MLFLLIVFFSCEGKVTDVGNPELNLPEEEQVTGDPSPALEDLLGPYTEPAGEPGADSADIFPRCRSRENAQKRIEMGAGSDKIILINFLDYGQSTRRIVADYAVGEISFEISENDLSLNCSGGATASAESIRITLDCDDDDIPGVNCSITFDRI